jgi:hypothetical protein
LEQLDPEKTDEAKQKQAQNEKEETKRPKWVDKRSYGGKLEHIFQALMLWLICNQLYFIDIQKIPLEVQVVHITIGCEPSQPKPAIKHIVIMLCGLTSSLVKFSLWYFCSCRIHGSQLSCIPCVNQKNQKTVG